MKPLTYIGILGLSGILHSYGQSDADALRYSYTFPSGTARSMGIGGAISALGGDFSALSSNPAGLGIYRKSEFAVTPSLVSVQNTSGFIGQKTKDYKYSFNFSNAGLVLSGLRRDRKGNAMEKGWVAVNFGMGFNRAASFHRKASWEAVNANNSLLDRYVEEANGTPYNNLNSDFPFSAGLAWQTYLIDTLAGDTTHYRSAIPNGNITQQKSINSRGSINEWLISVGANYENKLYLGAALGLPFLNYHEETNYAETDNLDTIAGFKSFTLSETLHTEGRGANLRLGLIYRVSDHIRIGGSVQTPTYYYLEDNYYGSMTSEFDTASYNYSSPEGSYKYDLYTPWKVTAGIALLLDKYGFLSADYEFTDHSLSYYNFGSGSTSDKLLAVPVNNAISSKYGPSHTARAGAELRMDKYHFRAGYALTTSPFKDSPSAVGADYSRSNYSLGFGFREEDYFLDFAFVHTATEDYHLPYSLESEATEGAANKTTANHFVVGVGFKF